MLQDSNQDSCDSSLYRIFSAITENEENRTLEYIPSTDHDHRDLFLVARDMEFTRRICVLATAAYSNNEKSVRVRKKRQSAHIVTPLKEEVAFRKLPRM